MRRYGIVSGILLILSIIDFALAEPVLVQEKRQSCVDVVHIPRDVIAVLGKRGEVGDWLDLMWDKYFKTSGKLVEPSDAHASSNSAPPGPDLGSTNVVQAPPPNPASSDAHASSSSAPLGPDHESTNVVQVPAPNPASSTANPNPLMKPSSPSSSESSVEPAPDEEWWYEGDADFHGPPYTPTSSVDLQAAIYTAKGKAKESRRISGAARDVEKTA